MTSSGQSYRLLIIASSLVLLTACRGAPVPPSPTASPSPRLPTTVPTPLPSQQGIATSPFFDTSTCPFVLPSGEVPGTTVDCGYLAVPERRSVPNSPMIKLALVRFRSPTGNVDGGPWVYVAGGWGDPVQGLISTVTGGLRAEVAHNHDFILYDQRGVGLSRPSLDCPEIRDAALAAYARPDGADAGESQAVAAAFSCRDRLVGQGIDLTAYTSAADAADLNDVRVALGYATLNLYGISYGTLREQTLLRDFPDAARSVVLDSAAPLQADLISGIGVSFDHALRLLFADCAADSRCHGAYPALEADFAQLVDQLNAQPAEITVSDAKTGRSFPVTVTGSRFVSLTFYWLYSARSIAVIPAMVAQLRQGRDALLVQFATPVLLSALATATARQYTILCSEDAPYEMRDAALGALQQALPEGRDVLRAGVEVRFAICAQWPVKPPVAGTHMAVVSATPALVLQSANDPATPPSDGQAVARTLANSFYVETSGIGHGVWGNGGDCVLRVMMEFVDDPTHKPDTACTAGLGVLFQTTY